MGQGRPHHTNAHTLEWAMTVHLSRIDELALVTFDRPDVLMR